MQPTADQTLFELQNAQQPYRAQIQQIAASLGLVEDSKAGFWHVSPYPQQDDLATLYETEYMNTRYPVEEEFSKEDLQTAARRYRPLMRDLKKFSPDGKRFLDIGSFGCETLYLARQEGWDVLGIDAAPEARRRAKHYDLELLQGFFGPGQALVQPGFDFINMGFVLEHVPFPAQFVAEAYRCLNAGGLLSVSVPNDFNPYQLDALKMGYVDRPWWVVPDEHVNYFSAYSLCDLLRQEGFDVLSVYNSFPIERYLLEGQNYVRNPEVGKHVYQQRQQWYAHFEQAGLEHLLEKLQRSWAAEGIGREVFVIARKA